MRKQHIIPNYNTTETNIVGACLSPYQVSMPLTMLHSIDFPGNLALLDQGHFVVGPRLRALVAPWHWCRKLDWFPDDSSRWL